MPAGLEWGHADRARIHTLHLPAGPRPGRRQLYDGRPSTVRATHRPRRQCLRQRSHLRLARVPTALAHQARARRRVCRVGAAAGAGARHHRDLERRPGSASAEVRPALRPAWLLAPLGRHAARRVARALGFGSEAAQPGRLLLALPAAALFLFCFWRAGVQVTGGLDPNFTVNAWGGPSYAGAMACHYLDLFLLAAGAAWLMDRILPALTRLGRGRSASSATAARHAAGYRSRCRGGLP